MEPPNRLDFVRLAEEMFQQELLKYNASLRAVEEELTVSESIDEEEVDELEIDELDFEEEKEEVPKFTNAFSSSAGKGNVEF